MSILLIIMALILIPYELFGVLYLLGLSVLMLTGLTVMLTDIQSVLSMGVNTWWLNWYTEFPFGCIMGSIFFISFISFLLFVGYVLYVTNRCPKL